ncbi:hypothetical protein AGOR_G00075840 [Albula goreensis]|uniref:Uncharacterized protein n=1 Tax=Albula goreensis TaxID=1534307 RepID=A0A8T3DWW0_9TELE|nr:hypothetical protein AGOR_G00075840 [Albula goreensis]
MEENETPPSRKPEVLIIPMTGYHHSPEEKASLKPPPMDPSSSPTSSNEPPAMSSLSRTKNSPSSDSFPPNTRTPVSPGSPQFLAELMQTQARRSPREPSPERLSLLSPPATPSVSPPAALRQSTPPVTPPLPLSPTQERGLSLSSPELLSELKQSRSLRHIKPQRGLTTVFSGRGRTTPGTTQVINPAGLSPPSPHAYAKESRAKAGSQPVANGKQQ